MTGMTESDSTETGATSCEQDDERLDQAAQTRRRLMQAALGGVAAGSTFLAPRISGFSVAPDYASAASAACGNTGNTTSSMNYASVGMNGCLINCWGNKNADNTGSGGCYCVYSPENCCSDFTKTLKIPNATNGPFVVDFNAGGRVVNSGRWNYNVNGIDPPFQSCNVQVASNCNGFTGGSNMTHNANGSASDNSATCPSAGNNNQTMVITFNCTCT